MRRGGVRRRGHGARLGWQARNEQVTRSTRSSLTGIRTVDWLRIAYPREGGGGDANASGSARARPRGYPGCVDGCRKECESEGGRGWFFSNQATCWICFFPETSLPFQSYWLPSGRWNRWDGRGAELSGGGRGEDGRVAWKGTGGYGARWCEGGGGRTFRYIEKIGTSSTVARFVPFRFVSPRPRFGTLRYVCSAVHLLAQYRGGIIITRGKERKRGR